MNRCQFGIAIAIFSGACGNNHATDVVDAGAEGDTDIDTNTDAKNDSDMDSDTATDSVSDTDTDADSDTDTDADSDTDTDSDTDMDSDTDSDTDTDTDINTDDDNDTDSDTNTDTDSDTEGADPEWWHRGWPYRIPVSVQGSGVIEVAVDFGAAMDNLGLNGGILDVRSLRVVPYDGAETVSPVPYQETYTTVLDNADAPQTAWSDSGVYWTANDGTVEADTSRFTEGTGSLKASIENREGGYGYPGVELHIAEGDPRSDWRAYEVFIYDVWPEVNDSALDQAPDLYSFKLYNTSGCGTDSITQGGPAMALDRWNPVSVSLNPLHTCTTPDLGDITRMEFHTRDNETVEGNSGLYDDGDELALNFDDLRLVDQNTGTIKWEADGAYDTYHIYFDTIEHEGHPLPQHVQLGATTATGIAGAPEAGGYFHRITGATGTSLEIWSAPPIEKIGRGYITPVYQAPLEIRAARNEYEPFQVVVKSSSSETLAVGISDFVFGGETISAANVALHRVDYVPISRLSDDFGRLGNLPDPLYPVPMGGDVDFGSEAQPLWFTVFVPPNATAGRYEATVSIGAAEFPVTLEVWGFELPHEIHLKGEWGFGWSSVVETYKGAINGAVQDCYWDLVDAFYEMFAAHRLVPKGVGWPAGLNYPGGVAYDCAGGLDPVSWGDWGFATLAQWYLDGERLQYSDGFPSFLIRGPASNYPPDSRPASFCEESRGIEPEGNPAYNARWFEYWTAVSDYLETSGRTGSGYYHIVNEPQTFADYDIVAYLAAETKAAAPNVKILVSEQVEPDIYENATYPNAKIDIWMPTISNYQVTRAHERQSHHDEEVWWYFLYGDRPPLPNPTIIDRTGLEARIIPWLAWAERVDGLFYYATTDWSPNPWDDAWINDGNGDGFMFYPPLDDQIGYDACVAKSNRLAPSIRFELLREGMEDYAYLYLLNGSAPVIDVDNPSDDIMANLVKSRTLFSRVPTDLYAIRAEVAAAILNERR